jgi:rRNA maturation RNase YbeY
MNELVLRNRQRTRPLRLPLLRRVALGLLTDQFDLQEFALGIHLVGTREMIRLNRRFLGHQGSTDVITFDHRVPVRRQAPFPQVPSPASDAVDGEIFICIDEALSQARRFRSNWQSELVRYLVHGVLHLVGFDDATPAARAVMKREEGRRLRWLSRRFHLKDLGISPTPRTRPGRKSPIANRPYSI